MRKVILLVLFVVIIFTFTGCGPGQPFEIESQHTPQTETPVLVAAFR